MSLTTRPTAPETPVATTSAPVSGRLLLVLALLSAVAPFSIDLYLPGFPEMAEDLSASATQVQLTLTGFLVGVMVGQLIFGPLSDRFGRLVPLLFGSVLCVVASVVATLAPNIEILIAGRFVQGLGGAAGMVIGRAIISDLSTGRAAARAFSLMMIVGGVAPVIAPLLGGFLVTPVGWRGLLGVVLGLAVLMTVSVVLFIRETLTPQRRAEIAVHRAEHGSTMKALRTRTFLGYAFTFAFTFAVLMGYISASPFLYQNMIGLSAVWYGVVFGVNALALTGVSALAARLVATYSLRGMVATGLALIVTSTATFGLLVILAVPAGWLAVPLFVAVASIGLILGNATGLAMSAASSSAGGASAVLGALQFGIAALVSPLVSINGEGTAGPLAVVMLASTVLAIVAFVSAGGRRVGIAEEPVELVD